MKLKKALFHNIRINKYNLRLKLSILHWHHLICFNMPNLSISPNYLFYDFYIKKHKINEKKFLNLYALQNLFQFFPQKFDFNFIHKPKRINHKKESMILPPNLNKTLNIKLKNNTKFKFFKKKKKIHLEKSFKTSFKFFKKKSYFQINKYNKKRKLNKLRIFFLLKFKLNFKRKNIHQNIHKLISDMTKKEYRMFKKFLYMFLIKFSLKKKMNLYFIVNFLKLFKKLTIKYKFISKKKYHKKQHIIKLRKKKLQKITRNFHVNSNKKTWKSKNKIKFNFLDSNQYNKIKKIKFNFLTSKLPYKQLFTNVKRMLIYKRHFQTYKSIQKLFFFKNKFKSQAKTWFLNSLNNTLKNRIKIKFNFINLSFSNPYLSISNTSYLNFYHHSNQMLNPKNLLFSKSELINLFKISKIKIHKKKLYKFRKSYLVFRYLRKSLNTILKYYKKYFFSHITVLNKQTFILKNKIILIVLKYLIQQSNASIIKLQNNSKFKYILFNYYSYMIFPISCMTIFFNYSFYFYNNFVYHLKVIVRNKINVSDLMDIYSIYLNSISNKYFMLNLNVSHRFHLKNMNYVDFFLNKNLQNQYNFLIMENNFHYNILSTQYVSNLRNFIDDSNFIMSNITYLNQYLFLYSKLTNYFDKKWNYNLNFILSNYYIFKLNNSLKNFHTRDFLKNYLTSRIYIFTNYINYVQSINLDYKFSYLIIKKFTYYFYNLFTYNIKMIKNNLKNFLNYFLSYTICSTNYFNESKKILKLNSHIYIYNNLHTYVNYYKYRYVNLISNSFHNIDSFSMFSKMNNSILISNSLLIKKFYKTYILLNLIKLRNYKQFSFYFIKRPIKNYKILSSNYIIRKKINIFLKSIVNNKIILNNQLKVPSFNKYKLLNSYFNLPKIIIRMRKRNCFITICNYDNTVIKYFSFVSSGLRVKIKFLDIQFKNMVEMCLIIFYGYLALKLNIKLF